MDGLSAAASVVAVVQLTESCLKLARKWLGPSQFSSSDLQSMTKALYAFNGVIMTFQTHLKIYEDDEARLICFKHLDPVFDSCKEALALIKRYMEGDRKYLKHLIGPTYDRKLKQALKVLDEAQELFTTAVHADNQTILLGLDCYLRNVGQDIRDVYNTVASMQTKLDNLAESQNEHFQRVEDWQREASAATASLGAAMHLQVARRATKDGQSILDWLAPPSHTSDQHEFLIERQNGTGKWFLGSMEYQAWVEAERSTLFCPGMPGAGKTILTAIVIEDLQLRFQDDPGIGIAYAYLRFRPKLDQQPEKVLMSLLRQLVQNQNPLPQGVVKLYESCKHKDTQPSILDIVAALSLAIDKYSQAFLIIDALDEYPTERGHRTTLLSNILSLQANAKANIFATSRPIPDLEMMFINHTTIPISADKDDIRAYIEDYLPKLPSFLSGRPDLQEEIKSSIINTVDGMFLLAKLYLASLEDKKTPKALKTAITHFRKQAQPTTNDERVEILALAYDNAMERIQSQRADSRQLATKTLSWLVCTTRPVTTQELQHGLAIEVGEPKLDQDNIALVDDIVSVCAGLVTVEQGSNIIRLVHHTTQEYFERKKASLFQNADTDIAAACATYLSFKTFTRLCKSYQEFEQRVQLYPFYTYAACSWGLHTRKSGTMSPEVVNFLEMNLNIGSSCQALFVRHRIPLEREVGIARDFPKQMKGLHLLAYLGMHDAMSTLLSKGHDPESRDSHGQTPLLWAAQCGNDDCVNVLLGRQGLDINSKDRRGRTALFRASENEQWNTFRLLLHRGADASVRDNSGRTLLSIVARHGHEESVQLLLSIDDVDASAGDKCNVTPLMVAVAFEKRKVAQQLLSRLECVYNPGIGLSAQRRLIREAWADSHPLSQLTLPLKCVDNDIAHWRSGIIGPPDTPYERGTFVIDIRIPAEYPFKVPTMKFVTKIYHPNVDLNGNVSVLAANWSPVMTIMSNLLTLLLLLDSPVLECSEMEDIVSVYNKDPARYKETARRWTRQFAIYDSDYVRYELGVEEADLPILIHD